MRRFAQPMAARVAGRSGDCAPVYFAQRKEVGVLKSVLLTSMMRRSRGIASADMSFRDVTEHQRWAASLECRLLIIGDM
jgi:hypothetical protein